MSMTRAYVGVISGNQANSDITVEDTAIYANQQAGIQLDFDPNVVIRRNRVYGVPGGSTLDNQAYGIQVGNGAPNANITDNEVFDNANTGILVLSGGGLVSTRVTGNTIYQDVGDAPQVIGVTNVSLYGNLLWTNSGRDVLVDATSQTGFASDDNLFLTGAAAANAHVGSFAGADQHTLADWQAATGRDPDSLAGDPRFVDIDGADNLLGYVAGVDRGRDDNFHLRANSPAIDHGDGPNQSPLDHDGEARADDPTTPDGPDGFTDIGACEFQGRSDDATRPTVVSTTPAGVHTGQTVGGPVTAIAVTFSEPLDTLDARSPSVYELVGAGPDGNFGTSDDVTYSLVPQYASLATNVTLQVSGGPLPGGTYRLTIRGTPAGKSGLHDLAGNVLDGDNDGQPGGDFTATFFTLGGDATRDRIVNFDDLLVLAKSYNKTGMTVTQADFTGDGLVNFDDLLVLAKNYNKTLPLPASAPATLEPAQASPISAQSLAAALGIATPAPTPTAADPTPTPSDDACNPVTTPRAPAPAPAPRPVTTPKASPSAKPAATPPPAPVFSVKKIPTKRVSELLA
jgi:hypothetical protein